MSDGEGVFDWTIHKGQPETLTLNFRLADGVTAKDISGITFKSQIRKNRAGTGTPDAEVLCSIVDGPAGILELSLTDDQTEALAPCQGGYAWDLSEDGIVIIGGKVNVKITVTKAA